MKTLKIIAILLVLSVTVFGTVHFFDFTGESKGGSILLKWRTTTETSNFQKFSILRKTPSSSFSKIGEVEPKGSNSSYEYNDDEVYKTNDAIYTYKIKFEFANEEPSYSNEISVTHQNVSSVKRTWGSIKALFR